MADPTATGRVGVVLVSHSDQVARSTAALAIGLLSGADEVPVSAAGGGEDGGLGTSERAIVEAARAADDGAGVVVISDLGSSVLTVRAMLADPDGAGAALPPGVMLADAPFLEGAVAAVVASSTGVDADAVRAAAEEAWTLRKLT